METVFTEFVAGEEQGVAFAAWVKLNPEGYVLNCDSAESANGMLHLGRCSHWESHDPRLQAARKIATTTKFMMDRWVAENLAGEPTMCSNCL